MFANFSVSAFVSVFTSFHHPKYSAKKGRFDCAPKETPRYGGIKLNGV
jgi:hypothetical protein